MLPNLTFNNIRKSYISVLDRKRPYWAPRKREVLRIEGMQGGHLTDTLIDVMVIQVRLLIEAESATELSKTVEDLTAWLNVDKPAPLQFDDQPDRSYLAVVDGELNPDEFVTYAELDVTFLIPSGAKMGEERKHVFTGELAEIDYTGSAATKPVFTAVVNQPITNLDIVTPETYMRVGTPATITETPVSRRTQILSDELATVTGWSIGTSADNGIVAGTMTSDAIGFKASSFGTTQNPANWQGPALRKNLTEQVQDFELEIGLEQISGIETIGMMEIALLDPAGAILVKVGIEDVFRQSMANQGKFQLGPLGANRKEFYRTPQDPNFWKDFRGMIRVTRVGRVWTVYMSEISETPDGGRPHNTKTSWTFTYTDYDGKYLAKAASVQVAIRKFSSATASNMRITRVQLWKLHEVLVQTSNPVYIAQTGDVIIINHKTNEITINGEPRLWLKDFGSTYFSLKPGKNPISYSPNWLVDLSVSWQDQYT